MQLYNINKNSLLIYSFRAKKASFLFDFKNPFINFVSSEHIARGKLMLYLYLNHD